MKKRELSPKGHECIGTCIMNSPPVTTSSLEGLRRDRGGMACVFRWRLSTLIVPGLKVKPVCPIYQFSGRDKIDVLGSHRDAAWGKLTAPRC